MTKQQHRLTRSFFEQETVPIAKSLIGKVLCFDGPEGKVSGIISETEAYTQEDPACHAFGGKRTKRNTVMFGPPGHAYIYFIYGMYYCLNVVTESSGRGCAVLIRGIIPLDGLPLMQKRRPKIKHEKDLANGPGKLVIAMGVPHSLNTHDMCSGTSTLYIEDRGINVSSVQAASRIGIRQGTDLLWRFILNK